MAWSVGVFCTECRAESINRTQRCCSQFTFQLSGNSQASLLAKEIVIIDNRSVLILLQIIQVLGGNLKHLTSSFTVGRCNNRSMEVEESLLVEEFMNGNSHIVTNTEHCAKRIGTRTQMSNLTQELHGTSLLLQRISIVTSTQYFNFTSLNFTRLSRSNRFY